MERRTYRKTRRAEQQAETRDRIIEATMALHEEVGPRETTVSAIAERAGVQRLTVYRHFPDDAELLQACTFRWLTLNPPPQQDMWADIGDRRLRLATALGAFYEYYRATETMWRRAYRDVDDVAALQGPMAEFEDYLDTVRDGLADDDAELSRPLLGMALRFRCWQLLRDQGEDETGMVGLMLEALLPRP